jgi:23S rRNA (cytidine1920-2'-O)/16S rRNA (cytidine1409-2'-O)-methyltransferase
MADTAKERLDVALVRLGLAESRASARASIEAGLVQVNGRLALKPAELTGPDAEISFERAHPWASRGGLKLDHALTAFAVDPAGRACLDIGSSTGGFTDVLLARGAHSVTSVDVGTGQMIARLRTDPRVRLIESTDARALTPGIIGEPPGLVVCDASYIGLAKVLPVPLSLAATGAELVALFKPQFEVGPAHVGRGGIVNDDAATLRAADALAAALSGLGWPVIGWTGSPIRGGDGNRERLLHARRSPD